VHTLVTHIYAAHAFRQAAAKASAASAEEDDDNVLVCAEDLRAAVDKLAGQRKLPAAQAPAGAEESPHMACAQPLRTTRSMARRAASHAAPPASRPVDAVCIQAEAQQAEAEGVYGAAGMDLWGGLPAAFLAEMQTVLEELGLNTAEGAAELAALPPDSPRFQQLAAELAGRLDMGIEEAAEALISWQKAQDAARAAAQAQQREADAARVAGRRALVPIWRCAVCGRADKPFIACYVSPFIVRYAMVDVNVAEA